jgi:hypothetical protein
MESGKHFFFEKKKQKTSIHLRKAGEITQVTTPPLSCAAGINPSTPPPSRP